MRILACSDLHEDLTATQRILAEAGAGAADVLGVAGDLGNKGQGADPVMALLRGAPCPVVLVPGTHDNLTAMRRDCHDWKEGHLLHGTGVTLQGTPFFGLGGEVPRTGKNLWNFALSDAQASKLLESCPPNAVLITHSPPKGHCDRQVDGTSEGSEAIRDVVQTNRPRLHLCGHIHASFGAVSFIGSCEIRNLGPVFQWFSA